MDKENGPLKALEAAAILDGVTLQLSTLIDLGRALALSAPSPGGHFPATWSCIAPGIHFKQMKSCKVSCHVECSISRNGRLDEQLPEPSRQH